MNTLGGTMTQKKAIDKALDAEMGFDLDFALDPIKDVATSVADKVGWVGDKVTPGFVKDFVNGPLHTLVTGPMKDFANTAVGKFALMTIATAFQGPLAWQIGPQLASIVWAAPGMLAGQDFFTSYTQELANRLKQTANYFAGQSGDAIVKLVGDQMAVATEWLKNNPTFRESAEKLAEKLGIRVDAAQYAKDLVAGVIKKGADALGTIYDPNAKFDPTTGRRVVAALGRGSKTMATRAAIVKTTAKAVDPRIAAKAGLFSPIAKQSMSIAVTPKLAAKAPLMTSAAPPTPPPPDAPIQEVKSAVPWALGGAAAGVAVGLVGTLALPLTLGLGAAGALGGYLLKKK
jgi:hypothetical protein